MGNKSKYIQVITTVAKKSDAERIAIFLSKKRLSACTQIIGPITSVYKWERKLEKSREWLCVIKTKENHYKEVEKIIKLKHSYELPEIIALPIIKGSREYLNWLNNELYN